jgi:hypothetical protein
VNRKLRHPPAASAPIARRRPILLACILAAVTGGIASAAALADSPRTPTAVPASQPQPTVAATLAECVVPAVQGERSATFAAEMTTLPGSVRMQMRIEVQERAAGEALFHTISAPGLSAWRTSEATVHIYKYLRQVTNLAAPAVYRAVVHFRWLDARGAVIRRAERLTPRCAQPAPTAAPAVVDRLGRRPLA